MKRRFYLWILMAVLCLCVFLPLAAAEQETVLLVYMVGSDLESENGLAAKDLEEMQKHFPQGENVKLLVCLGGAKYWSIGISPEIPTIYALDEEGLHELQSLSVQSMTCPEALSSFLAYAHEHVPCENTALILWDHGSGPLIGFGIDETADNDKLTFTEMREAFSVSPYAGENKLKWIGFDACLMGSLEMAVMLEPYADYLIASEEVELPCGWDYSFVSLLGEETDAQTLSSEILQRFYQMSVDACGGNPILMPSITLAVYDLSKSEALVQSLEKLFEQMHSTLEFGGFAQMARVRAGIDKLGRFSGGLTTELVDLRQLIDTLHEAYADAAQKALEQLDAFVIGCATNNPQYSGLSVYFPFDDKASYLSLGKLLYQEIGFSEAYIAFVDRFARDWLAGTLEKMTLLNSTRNADEVMIELDERQLQDYESARFIIFEKMTDGYVKYLSSNDVLLGDSILQIRSAPKLAYLVNEDTEERFPIDLTYVEENATYWFYDTSMLLKRYTAENTEYALTDLQIAVDKNTLSGMLVSAYQRSDDTHGKRQIQLSDWDVMEYWNAVYVPVYDASGQLLACDEWNESGAFTGWGLDTDVDFHLEMAPITEYNEDLYIQFLIRDVYGNITNSDLIEIWHKQITELEAEAELRIWADQQEHVILLDRDDLRIEAAYEEKKLCLIVENRTDKTLTLRAENIAVNHCMVQTAFIYGTVLPGERLVEEISVEAYAYELQPKEQYKDLQFLVTVSKEGDYYETYYEGQFHIAIDWMLRHEEEISSYRNEEYGAPFCLKEQILYEDENLCIEAVPLSIYMNWSDKQETILLLKCRNKTVDTIHINLGDGYVNEWMYDEMAGNSILPGTWAYQRIPVNHDMFVDGKNVMSLTLEWYVGRDFNHRQEVALPEFELQRTPAGALQDCFSVSASDYCVIEQMEFCREEVLSSSSIQLLVRNTSEKHLKLYVELFDIDGIDVKERLGEKILYPGKKKQIQIFLPWDEAFDVSPYGQPIETMKVDIEIVDAHTEQVLENVKLTYESIAGFYFESKK